MNDKDILSTVSEVVRDDGSSSCPSWDLLAHKQQAVVGMRHSD